MYREGREGSRLHGVLRVFKHDAVTTPKTTVSNASVATEKIHYPGMLTLRACWNDGRPGTHQLFSPFNCELRREGDKGVRLGAVEAVSQVYLGLRNLFLLIRHGDPCLGSVVCGIWHHLSPTMVCRCGHPFNRAAETRSIAYLKAAEARSLIFLCRALQSIPEMRALSSSRYRPQRQRLCCVIPVCNPGFTCNWTVGIVDGNQSFDLADARTILDQAGYSMFILRQ